MSTREVAGFLSIPIERLQRLRGQGVLPIEPVDVHNANRLRWPTAAVAKAVGLDFEIVDGGGDVDEAQHAGGSGAARDTDTEAGS